MNNRTSIRSLATALIVFMLAACTGNQELPFTVVVYPTVKRCTVVQQEKEQEVDCIQLGTFLHDTLKINVERQINVSLSGSDPVAKEDKSIDRIADLIRASGYKDVRTFRFGL